MGPGGVRGLGKGWRVGWNKVGDCQRESGLQNGFKL